MSPSAEEARELAREAELDARIAEARHKLAVRLGELERRVERVKDRVDEVRHKLDPHGWMENPWLRVGVALGLGLVLGRSSALRPIFRGALGTAVTTLVNQAVKQIQ